MVCEEVIKKEYPLHWLVWNNDYKTLEAELAKKEVKIVIFLKLFGVETFVKLIWVARFHDS